MSRKTHQTAIVLIPPEEIWPPIQAIRRKHDKQLRRWMPHLTLIYPFRPKNEFGYLSAEFSRICEKITPFQVMFDQFNFFEHGHENYTIWLEPSPKDPLVSLQETLLSIVPECDDVNRFAGGFVPHLSVGQVRGKTKFNRLIKELQSGWQPLSFVVREISLIWRETPPDDIFQVRSRVELKQHKAKG